MDQSADQSSVHKMPPRQKVSPALSPRAFRERVQNGAFCLRK
jgi:hypothetical protein